MNYKLSEVLFALECINDDSFDTKKRRELLSTLLKKFNCKNLDQLNDFLVQQKKILHQKMLKDINNDKFKFVWPSEKDYLTQRSVWNNSFVVEKIAGFLSQYADWRSPVAYLEPNTGELMRHIISGDPFYIIDDYNSPTQKILEKFPTESSKKFLKYTKKEASEHIEPNSVGLTICYKNIPFQQLGSVRKTIELMSKITKPGGIVIFDYVDAGTSRGAAAVEKHNFAFQWKERIHSFLNENNLEIINEFDDKHHISNDLKVCFCRKKGKVLNLNIINKIGIVLPNEKHLEKLRLEKEKENLEIRAAKRSKIEEELRKLKEINHAAAKKNKKIQPKKDNILELKLKTALTHFNKTMSMYQDYQHPSVLESLLHVSKLTYSLGRIKDSKNLIKRVERDIAKMSENNSIAKKYREWQDFLNNIDT
jgi:hypothetical protein